MQAGNLGQLSLVLANKVLNVIFGSILDVGQLLANTGQDDVFCGHAVLQHHVDFSLWGRGHMRLTHPNNGVYRGGCRGQ